MPVGRYVCNVCDSTLLLLSLNYLDNIHIRSYVYAFYMYTHVYMYTGGGAVNIIIMNNVVGMFSMGLCVCGCLC